MMGQLSRIRLLAVSIGATALLTPIRPATAGAQEALTEELAQVSRLDREGEFDEALNVLRPLLLDNPDNYDLLCWMAEVLVDKAAVVAGDSSPREAKPVCQEAVTYARRAVEVRPGGAEGWFQVGQATGRLSQLPGGGETVDYCAESKAAFEKAISIDRGHTGAIHGLGQWHCAVANLPGVMKLAAKVFYGGLPKASNEEAVRLFKRAIGLEPDVIIHHLELGRTYLEMRQKELAKEEFETVLRLPAVTYFDTQRKSEARRLLSEIRR